MRAVGEVCSPDFPLKARQQSVGRLAVGVKIEMADLFADDPRGHRVDVESKHVTPDAVCLDERRASAHERIGDNASCEVVCGPPESPFSAFAHPVSLPIRWLTWTSICPDITDGSAAWVVSGAWAEFCVRVQDQAPSVRAQAEGLRGRESSRCTGTVTGIQSVSSRAGPDEHLDLAAPARDQRWSRSKDDSSSRCLPGSPTVHVFSLRRGFTRLQLDGPGIIKAGLPERVSLTSRSWARPPRRPFRSHRSGRGFTWSRARCSDSQPDHSVRTDRQHPGFSRSAGRGDDPSGPTRSQTLEFGGLGKGSQIDVAGSVGPMSLGTVDLGPSGHVVVTGDRSTVPRAATWLDGHRYDDHRREVVSRSAETRWPLLDCQDGLDPDSHRRVLIGRDHGTTDRGGSLILDTGGELIVGRNLGSPRCKDRSATSGLSCIRRRARWVGGRRHLVGGNLSGMVVSGIFRGTGSPSSVDLGVGLDSDGLLRAGRRARSVRVAVGEHQRGQEHQRTSEGKQSPGRHRKAHPAHRSRHFQQPDHRRGVDQWR